MYGPNRIASLIAVSAALFGCGGAPVSMRQPTDPLTDSTEGSSAEAPPAATTPLRDGVLVAYAGGREIGRERYRDDGRTLLSEIVLAGTKFTLTIDRAAHRVVVEAGTQRVEREYDAGTLVLENGSWQSYALALEAYADAREAKPVRVLIPGQGVTAEGTVRVRERDDGAHRVELSLGSTAITAEVNGGEVRRVTIPAQGIEVLPEGVVPATSARRGAPEGIVEEAVEVNRAGVALRGVLWVPEEREGPLPIVVLVAGSGPTDRDGNQSMGLRTDTYRLLAEGLARQGVASLRYDKRGIGESGTNFAVAETVFDDFVEDALAMVEHAAGDERFRGVTLAGHSEGGLIALRVARRASVRSVVLLAAAGRPIATLLREQLARQLDAETMAELDRILAELRAGRAPDRVPEVLTPVFHPAVQAFVRSMMDIDPGPLARRVRVPMTIIQGETDAQVSVEDARLLARAQRRARLVLVPSANHLFKDEPSAALPQESYTDPSRPIVPAVLDALVAAARR